MIKKLPLVALVLFFSLYQHAFAQYVPKHSDFDRNHAIKFEQMGTLLPTPNVYRTASGAPGHLYWQQRADYEIEVELNDDNQSIEGKQTITYFNNSPDPLTYLWVQLDQNMRAKDSDTYKTATSRITPQMSARQIERMLDPVFDGGFKLRYVNTANDQPFNYTVNKTMMRIDLEEPLKEGEQIDIKIGWYYNINDRMAIGGRSGYEYFEEDDNYLYTIAQFFPRMAVYSDNEGWQNKQFLGAGEFALPFGDYKVKITVPSDHMVASTGELQNAEEVLTKEQIDLYEKAKTATKPVIIVSEKEAKKNEKSRAKTKKTWEYHAQDVRDFAFASSRKFIWDAMGVEIGGKNIMAMSYYPKEGNPLWEQYSTEAVAHTLRVYSKHTIDYPYPVAISVHADAIGMEYPMICFNFGRPDKDGNYSERIKYGMIGVIIHEVGHNFFPMIINSDERQWTWMDEGLNTFVQFLAEQEWDRDWPHRRGPAHMIVPYMRSSKDLQEPIMSNSENIVNLGANAYSKAATGLNILRETIMGRELFDYAFKEYSRRWAFKHPTPADFFRTMEDASGVDLDWYWKGWYYTTEHVDIAIENVDWYKLDDGDPDAQAKRDREDYERNMDHIARTRNRTDIPQTALEANKDLIDIHNTKSRFDISADDKKAHKTFKANLSPAEKALFDKGYHFYQIDFENVGGMLMPIILEFTYTDGSTEEVRIPAEIWRKNEKKISKVFPREKEIKQIVLDPYRETADVDETNNYWPRQHVPDRFELYKSRR
ncbi:MAG: M1 family metallopeptidase [Cyclobacteriaceae bacterium]|nr:M1 family metallopeptidase [Cyclobacteriaceae bacterium]MCH8516407.1 M1 family metallopeptidase [Cyclobacteriaceae bacterium]